MGFVLVENGKVLKKGLPETGVLKDGSTVTGYHLLDEETLKQEGWLPLEDNPPEYNPETQYITNDGYEVFKDKVVKKYKVVDKPASEPSYYDYALDLDYRLSCLELNL